MAIGIGTFQVENLIRNKVPFLLLRDESDLSVYFGPIEKIHLQNYSAFLPHFSDDEAQAALKEKGGQAQTPIVVLCHDGTKSRHLAEVLTQKGFMNVYFVLDGLQSFRS